MDPADSLYRDGILYWLEGVPMEDEEEGGIVVGLVSVLVEGEKEAGTTRSSEEVDNGQAEVVLIEFRPENKRYLEEMRISVVRCGDKSILVLILYYRFPRLMKCTVEIKLYQVDRNDSSFSARELPSSPTSLTPGSFRQRLVIQADDECVYVCGANLTSYHVELSTWRDHGVLPDEAFCKPHCLKQCVRFRPGLDPFVLP
ncbi:hypothetical protein R1flu_003059 [Riccia fluitans]|uniref:Uncharacterized protein n=1 Tax=Riccia fluitans TaxID=41844 RepID=A0ABD1Y8U6_9MARC